MLARRLRLGLISLAAAAGPAVALPVLLIDGSVRTARGQRDSARRSFIAGGVLCLFITAGVVFFITTGMKNSFWIALLAVQLIVAITVIYSSVYTYLGQRRLGVLLAMRIVAVLLLLLILFKPVLLIPPDLAGRKPALAVLVDRSGSMATADETNLPDRYSQALQMLHSQEDRIGRHFKPVWIDFAAGNEKLDALSDLRQVQPRGEGTDATDIASAIRVAGNQAESNKLAGVLLISDGINNVSANPVASTSELGAPVYTLAVGAARKNQAPGKVNFELLSVEAPFVAAVNNVAEISARVRISNLPNAAGEVSLLEGDSTTPIATEKIGTTANDETVTVRFNWTPRMEPEKTDKAQPATRIRKLRLVVSQNNLEITSADNSAEFHVLLTNPKIRVLYIEGTIRPEYKYLRRLLQSDPNIQFVGLIRISENKFWSQGSIGGRKLQALPASDDDFKMFDVIILGDLDSSFLSRDQQSRLRAFVNGGGGLLMIGGRNSFGPGGYGGTEIAGLLPVEVGPKSIGQEPLEFLPMFTAAGEAHPVFAGITGYFPGPNGRQPDSRLAKLPKLRGCVRVLRAKPAAAILALHPTASGAAGPLVVLAVQQYGAGRSAALTADTTWQWYLPMQAMGAQSPYHRFWGQLILWLGGAESAGSKTGSDAILRLDKNHGRLGAEAIKLSALVHDLAGQPAKDAHVICEISPAKSDLEITSRVISLFPGLSAGNYTGTLEPKEPGEYVVKLTASNAAGDKLGSDELPLSVAPQSTELENLARNDKLLREIAVKSQGRFAELSALPDLLDQIIAKQQETLGPLPAAKIRRLYNFPIFFILFVGLLTTEWILRRSWQMH